MNQHNHHRKFPQISPPVIKNVENVTNNATKPDLNNFSQPLLPIKLPFPPTIRASDIAQKRLRSRICSKSPNAFFVYRKAFVEHLSNSKGNNKLKMTEVSRLVSSHWKMESKHVKVAYENIARQVEKELNDIRKKDLVYTNDFDIGNGRRKKNKNHKRGRRPNSEFGSDAFFMSLKGNANFNISTLDFSVKTENDNDNNSKSSSLSQPVSSFPESSIVEREESANYEESSSSDEEVIITNEFNGNVDNIQQNNFEFTNPNSEVGFELICCDPNILDPIIPDLYSQFHQDEFNLYESLLKNNENLTSNSSFDYPDVLDYYLGHYC